MQSLDTIQVSQEMAQFLDVGNLPCNWSEIREFKKRSLPVVGTGGGLWKKICENRTENVAQENNHAGKVLRRIFFHHPCISKG